MNSPYGKDFECTLLANVESVSDGTAIERIRTNFSQYMSTWYDIQHTKDQKAVFKSLRDLNPKTLMIAEYLTSFSKTAQKKSKREPYLYLLRQAQPPFSLINSGSIEKHLYGDCFDYMLMDSWSEDFIGFVN